MVLLSSVVCLFVCLFFNDVMENMVNLKGRIFKKKKLILNENHGVMCVEFGPPTELKLRKKKGTHFEKTSDDYDE